MSSTCLYSGAWSPLRFPSAITSLHRFPAPLAFGASRCPASSIRELSSARSHLPPDIADHFIPRQNTSRLVTPYTRLQRQFTHRAMQCCQISPALGCPWADGQWLAKAHITSSASFNEPEAILPLEPATKK